MATAFFYFHGVGLSPLSKILAVKKRAKAWQRPVSNTALPMKCDPNLYAVSSTIYILEIRIGLFLGWSSFSFFQESFEHYIIV